MDVSNTTHHHEHEDHRNETDSNVPMVFLLLIITGYCCFGAWVMHWKNPEWSFLDGAYFWFITITTVGFGDLEFSQKSHTDHSGHANAEIFLQMAVIAFVVIGLALMAAFLTLCIERGQRYKRVLRRLMCSLTNDLRGTDV